MLMLNITEGLKNGLAAPIFKWKKFIFDHPTFASV
jgi:hypothetical protein